MCENQHSRLPPWAIVLIMIACLVLCVVVNTCDLMARSYVVGQTWQWMGLMD
jgi:hypothetical protein